VLNEIGVRTELLDRDALAERFPQFDLDGVGIGAWEDDAGYADPAGTTLGLFERAVELGAVPRLGTAVVAIEELAGGGAAIVADDGERATCKRLLIAAGPWTAPLARQIGVDLPLTVERHIVATFSSGAAPVIPFTFSDLVGGYYFKPDGDDGQFGLGPMPAKPEVDPDDFAEEITDGEAMELAEALVQRVPDMEKAQPRGGWASLYDVSPDWQPVIGEIAPGVFVDAGTSGHGFKLAPALGSHVADLVLGEDVDPGLAQFRPSRFADGELIDAGYGAVKILG
jgi:glycine/D-amino acid oxidase-like deaminating enzyme